MDGETLSNFTQRIELLVISQNCLATVALEATTDAVLTTGRQRERQKSRTRMADASRPTLLGTNRVTAYFVPHG